MPGDPFYQTREWHKLRSKVKAVWKRANYPCAWCKQPVDWSARPIVDHVKPRKTHPQLAHEMSNLVVMCHPCHSRKTAHVDHNKRPAVGNDGFPVDGEWGEVGK